MILAGPKCEAMLQLVFGKYAAGIPLCITLVNYSNEKEGTDVPNYPCR
jgi:hypothetical protein